MDIYTASSWRNGRYREVLDSLKLSPHNIYDFQHDGAAFDWKDIDPEWDSKKDIVIPSVKIQELLNHPLAVEAFRHDFTALENADLLILVNPCGKSAHIEAGVAYGKGIPVWILLDETARPELTYRIAEFQTDSLEQLVWKLERTDYH